MSQRNLLNSNMWQIVSPDNNTEPNLIYNRYIPIPNATQVGGVKPDNITIFQDGFGTISAIGNGSLANTQFVPYLSFISNQTASANQTFSSNLLVYYQGNATFATVSVDGAILQPNVDFALGGNFITIYNYLLANSLVEIQAKVLPAAPIQEVYITTEAGDNVVTENGDLITTQQTF